MSHPVPSVPSGLARRRRSRASGPRSWTIGVQTVPGAIALLHRRHGGARREKHRFEVNGHHAVPLVLLRIHEVLARLDADVVVEDVEPSPALAGLRHHPVAVGRARHVGGEDRRLAALVADDPHGLLRALLELVDAQDACALTREEDGRRLAVAQAWAPRPGPRDDRDLARQSITHGLAASSAWTDSLRWRQRLP